jgi:transmembrane E3 ubiquitin-protein ligase
MNALAKQHLNKTITTRIKEQEDSPYLISGNPWSASTNPQDFLFPTPHCELVAFFQQHPVGQTLNTRPIQPATLHFMEYEMRHPTGAPVPEAPDMIFSMTLFSPDCGFMLESKGPPEYTLQEGNHLTGSKKESYTKLAKRFGLLLACIYAAQVWLLVRQMNDSSTPSTISRVSMHTISIMAFGDGFAFTGLLVVGAMVEGGFMSFVTTAFFALLCVSFFGMKFLIAIWRVQLPEVRERAPPAPATAAPPRPPVTGRITSPPVITPGGADVLPDPVTARIRDPPVVILPPDQDLDAAAEEDEAIAATTNQTTGTVTRPPNLGALYSRFYFTLLGTVFLSIHATSWPTTLRSAYMNLLVTVYLSLWTPQIYRNVMRNCRKALRWDFVIGQSILRLLPILYIYHFPHNILYVEPDDTLAVAFTLWVWVQVLVLVIQEVIGPRLFVPKGWAPPAYDYHPVISEDDLESGALIPIGFNRSSDAPGESSSMPLSPLSSGIEGTDKKNDSQRAVDCSICMQPINVPVVPAGGMESAVNILGRREYMLAPCRHIFHTRCLEYWMRSKLQCPMCRETLPPL